MGHMTRRAFAGGIGLLPSLQLVGARAQTGVPPAEARAIAKEAYVYGEPMVDNYRIQYAYWVDRTNPEYKGGFNQVWNSARLFTPDDKAIQTPNSDTLYSMIGADVRAEPLVLTVPAMEKERYFSVQFIDYYTFNFAYAGTRTTGNGGGNFLLTGPDWKGETPKGIDTVFRSETELVFPGIRTQLFNPSDIDNVKKVQAGYKVQPLSKFLGQTAPAPRARHRVHQAADSGGAKNIPRVFQHPELRPAILPDGPVRGGTQVAFRQNWRPRGQRFRR
jgi:hypothetical protein